MVTKFYTIDKILLISTPPQYALPVPPLQAHSNYIKLTLKNQSCLTQT